MSRTDFVTEKYLDVLKQQCLWALSLAHEIADNRATEKSEYARFAALDPPESETFEELFERMRKRGSAQRRSVEAREAGERRGAPGSAGERDIHFLLVVAGNITKHVWPSDYRCPSCGDEKRVAFPRRTASLEPGGDLLRSLGELGIAPGGAQPGRARHDRWGVPTCSLPIQGLEGASPSGSVDAKSTY